MMYMILMIIFYVFPALTAYLGIRMQYKREWEGISPGIIDGILVLLPLVNIGYSIFVIMIMVTDVVDKAVDRLENKGSIDYRKLFLLKDENKEDE